MGTHTRGELIDLLLTSGRDLGRAPHMRDLEQQTVEEVLHTFGSWREALDAAGYVGNLLLEKLIEKYDERTEEIGHAPSMTEFQPYCQVLYRHYKSWDRALAAMGRKQVTALSEGQTIQLLLEKEKELGKTPSISDFDSKTGRSILRLLGQGSWEHAIRRAGLKPQRQSKDELLQLIREKAAELGYIPRAIDLPESTTVLRRFGSWNAAIAAAGLEQSPHSRCRVKKSQEEIWEDIRKLAQELGRPPRWREYPQAGQARKRFGKRWSEIVAEALHEQDCSDDGLSD